MSLYLLGLLTLWQRVECHQGNQGPEFPVVEACRGPGIDEARSCLQSEDEPQTLQVRSVVQSGNEALPPGEWTTEDPGEPTKSSHRSLSSSSVTSMKLVENGGQEAIFFPQ